MYFWDSVLVVLRRWYVVVPTLAIALALAVGATKLVPAAYEASGTVVFIAPPGGENTTNPLFDSLGLAGTADVVSQIVGSVPGREALKDSGVTGSFTLTRLADSQAPALVVTVKGGSATVVMSTLQAVIHKVQAELATQQSLAGVKGRVIQANTVTVDRTATPVHGNRMRAAVAVGGLGCVLAISSAFLTESAVLRRRQRQQATEVVDPVRGVAPGAPRPAGTVREGHTVPFDAH